MKIAPGVRINLTKKGVSARVGPRGAGITTGTSGTTVSAGIPGSGLHVSEKIKSKKKGRKAPSQSRSINADSRTSKAPAAQGMRGLDKAFWVLVVGMFGLMFWVSLDEGGAVAFFVALIAIAPFLAVALVVMGLRMLRRWHRDRRATLENIPPTEEQS